MKFNQEILFLIQHVQAIFKQHRSCQRSDTIDQSDFTHTIASEKASIAPPEEDAEPDDELDSSSTFLLLFCLDPGHFL